MSVNVVVVDVMTDLFVALRGTIWICREGHCYANHHQDDCHLWNTHTNYHIRSVFIDLYKGQGLVFTGILKGLEYREIFIFYCY